MSSVEIDRRIPVTLLTGFLGDQKIVFLPRHGRGHPIPPSAIDNRANIDALKRCGVTEVMSGGSSKPKCLSTNAVSRLRAPARLAS